MCLVDWLRNFVTVWVRGVYDGTWVGRGINWEMTLAICWAVGSAADIGPMTPG